MSAYKFGCTAVRNTLHLVRMSFSVYIPRYPCSRAEDQFPRAAALGELKQKTMDQGLISRSD